MTIQTFFETLRQYAGDEAWVYQVFVVVLVVVILNTVLRMVINRLHRRFEKTRTVWDDALLYAIGRPLRLLVWIVGLSFAAQIIHSISPAFVFEAIGPIRDVGVIAAIAWFLSRFISSTEKSLIEKAGDEQAEVDFTTTQAIARLLRISVIITSALVALQTLGYSISGVLAFGGIGGIAIGFAAKDMLSNFFGGMMIFLDRPFSVGDWVRSPDRDIEGTVEHIGWRLTRIRSFDKRPLYIPNSVFTTIAVQNPSRMTHRRLYETIGVRYNDVDHLPAIISDIEQMLRTHPDIDAEQTLMVNFNAYAASSLDFFVYAFTRTTVWTEFHAVKQDVLFRIHAIIARHGAEIAFPTSTLHVPEPVTLQQAGVSGNGPDAP